MEWCRWIICIYKSFIIQISFFFCVRDRYKSNGFYFVNKIAIIIIVIITYIYIKIYCINKNLGQNYSTILIT